MLYSWRNFRNPLHFSFGLLYLIPLTVYFLVFYQFFKEIGGSTHLGIKGLWAILGSPLSYALEAIDGAIDVFRQIVDFIISIAIKLINLMAGVFSFLQSFWYVIIVALILYGIVVLVKYSWKQIKENFKCSVKTILEWRKITEEWFFLTLGDSFFSFFAIISVYMLLSFSVAPIFSFLHENITNEEIASNSVKVLPTKIPIPSPTPVLNPRIEESRLLCAEPYGKPVWSLNADASVEVKISDCKPANEQKFCAAETLVALGRSSASGERSKEIDRAEKRGKNLAEHLKIYYEQECSQQSSQPKVYVLNLGQPKDKSSDSESDRKVQVYLGKDISDKLTLESLLRDNIDQQKFNFWRLSLVE